MRLRYGRRQGCDVGDDHLALVGGADRAGVALPPEVGGVGADDRVELVLGGFGVIEAGDERLEGVVDAPPAELGPLPGGGQAEQAQRGEGVDLQRLVADLPVAPRRAA